MGANNHSGRSSVIMDEAEICLGCCFFSGFVGSGLMTSPWLSSP